MLLHVIKSHPVLCQRIQQASEFDSGVKKEVLVVWLLKER
ncbi:hypothetical protein A45J_0725 [hot springs metagenome]|uniref:Uncharacterized protein n=1 Tax=hot springs metagenome TaxID=433727 RepID=A0A5J4KUY8_9ZZZZ